VSFELSVVKMLVTRDSWTKLKGAIPRSGLDEMTKNVVLRISDYYKAFPEVKSIVPEQFTSWYFGTVKIDASPELKAKWGMILENMQKPISPEIEAGLFDSLLQVGTTASIADALNSFAEGEDVDVISVIQHQIDKYKENRKRKVESPIVDNNVLDLMDDMANLKGIKWREPYINEHIRPMIAGDFIGVAARPDKGKTSFITDNGSFFASQVEEIFGPNRPIMWLCNEGTPRKIWLRMYQSILNMSMTELGKFRRDKCKGNDEKFLDAVFSKIGGRDNFLIIDAHKLSNTDIEEMVDKHNPSIVIYDMIDNINFNGSNVHGGTRTDQVLESMYQWARELAARTSHIAIATSQISGEGEGEAFPALSMLKDSKTGKQGTFDTLLMIGAVHTNGMEDIRFLSTPKNKLRVDGSPSNMKIQVVFDGSRGRFNVGSATEDAPQKPSSTKTDRADSVPDI
jgi:replicative DNA helicase